MKSLLINTSTEALSQFTGNGFWTRSARNFLRGDKTGFTSFATHWLTNRPDVFKGSDGEFFSSGETGQD